MLAYKVVTLHRYSINSVIGLELYYEKGRTVRGHLGSLCSSTMKMLGSS